MRKVHGSFLRLRTVLYGKERNFKIVQLNLTRKIECECVQCGCTSMHMFVCMFIKDCVYI